LIFQQQQQQQQQNSNKNRFNYEPAHLFYQRQNNNYNYIENINKSQQILDDKSDTNCYQSSTLLFSTSSTSTSSSKKSDNNELVYSYDNINGKEESTINNAMNTFMAIQNQVN
jgi:hypothetical protein